MVLLSLLLLVVVVFGLFVVMAVGVVAFAVDFSTIDPFLLVVDVVIAAAFVAVAIVVGGGVVVFGAESIWDWGIAEALSGLMVLLCCCCCCCC